MARKAEFAGSFYEKDEFKLDKQITECFEGKNGPGALPMLKRNKKIQAIIAPHAGYQYSGPAAAWTYKEIAEAEFAELYIILGPNHHSNECAISIEGYETPFGVARVDQEFAKSLMEKNKNLKDDNTAHKEEHSIEVQIPFLQFATKDKMHELKIVPILLGQDFDSDKLALDLKETIIESGKKVVIIVSSDFTHYGRNYHYIPFSQDVKKNIYKMDREAIDLIEHLDSKGFINYIDEKMATICGSMAIAVLLKTLKKSKVELLNYYTSADLEKDSDYKNSVSYAAIVFR